MNNAQMFSSQNISNSDQAARNLVRAAERYAELRGIKCKYDPQTVVAMFAASDAMPGFFYEVGEIVNVLVDGIPHYGTVEEVTHYSASVYSGIRIKSPDKFARGVKYVRADRPCEYKAMVPDGLVDLIRSQLTASCPLKEAACGR